MSARMSERVHMRMCTCMFVFASESAATPSRGKRECERGRERERGREGGWEGGREGETENERKGENTNLVRLHQYYTYIAILYITCNIYTLYNI